MSTAARVKTRTLLRNTLIFRVLKYLVAKPLAWLWKGLKKLHAFNMSILRGLPLVGKTALFLGVLAIVELNVTAAADGGPLALLKDGDTIHLDVMNGILEATDVTPEEFAERKKSWKRPEKDIPNGYLRLYSKVASSAAKGAVIDEEQIYSKID